MADMSHSVDVNTLILEPVDEEGASRHARIGEQLQEKLQALTAERAVIGVAIHVPAAEDRPGRHIEGVALTRSTDQAHEISVEALVDSTDEGDRDAVERRLDAGWDLISWHRDTGEGTTLLVFQRERS